MAIVTSMRSGARYVKPFAWSFSRLKNFETCPKRHYEIDLVKSVSEPKGQALDWGSYVHDKMAARCGKDRKPLPENVAMYEPWAVKILGNTPAENIFVEQNLTITSNFTPTGNFDKDAWLRVKCDLYKIVGDVALAVDWKGLSLDTPIPTPKGFSTMRDLKVGDLVFGTDGKAYPVLGKSEVKNLPCYSVTVPGVGTVVCDEEHLWELRSGAILPAKTLAKLSGKQRIALPSPVEYPHRELPIDPYVFGFWLADGKHTSSEISKPDQFIWDEVVRRGYVLGKQQGSTTIVRSHTVTGIRGHLSTLGVLGNKHIPDIYRYCSVAQRQDLVRGFMDGDGSANYTRKQTSIESTNEPLIRQLAEVVRSLGERASVCKFIAHGFGLTKDAWMLNWRPRVFNPFLLPRKANKASMFGVGEEFLEISVAPTASVPTQCISVGSPNHMYLCGKEYIPTHNTGKIVDDSVQLALTAACLLYMYPQLNAVKCMYVWFKEDAESSETFYREDLPGIWRSIWHRIEAMELAHKHTDYPPKPSGICVNFCAVKSCPHNGKGTR